MLQEVSDNGKRSSKNDLLLCGILVLLMVFAKLISDLVKRLPSPIAGAAQLLIFLGIVALCYFIYRKVLCSYRYTLVYAPPDPEDLDAFGQPKARPYPLGTLTIERMVGDKGRICAQVQAGGELKALLPPGTVPEKGLKRELFTVRPRAAAHQLHYVEEGREKLAYFTPSPEMAERLRAMLEDRPQ